MPKTCWIWTWFRPGGDKINDPVRTYLREMGTVPLLSREGETEIARRIERGQNTVMKTLSRSPLVIQEILDLAEEVRRGTIRGARRGAGGRPAEHRRCPPKRAATAARN